jgi:hypothetical protein
MAKAQPHSVNKSAAIRGCQARNPEAAPREIAAILVAQGVGVTAAEVRSVLANDRLRSKERVQRKVAKRPTLDDLLLTKRMVEAVGGIEKAKEAIDGLAKIVKG